LSDRLAILLSDRVDAVYKHDHGFAQLRFFFIRSIFVMSDCTPTFLSTDDLLAHLQWRYAVKKFDPIRKISAADWHALEQSLILSPSSLGLQPWKFFVVETPELRSQLPEFSWGQTQVVDASHLVVFAIKTEIDDAYVDHYLARMAEVRDISIDSLAPFAQMARGFISGRSADELKDWAKLQVYIALGQFMTSAAHLGIDTCPMEGFIAADYDRILGLTDKGYASVVLCPAGYRDPSDRYAQLPKVRFPSNEMIETL
jgi:nitroreductase